MVGEGGREGVVVLGISFSFRGGRSRSWALVSFIAGVVVSWTLVVSGWGVVVVRGAPWALSCVGVVVVRGAGRCR